MCPGVFYLDAMGPPELSAGDCFLDRREHILREGQGRESGLIPAGLPRFEQC